jgi:hypothetical protein
MRSSAGTSVLSLERPRAIGLTSRATRMRSTCPRVRGSTRRTSQRSRTRVAV